MNTNDLELLNVTKLNNSNKNITVVDNNLHEKLDDKIKTMEFKRKKKYVQNCEHGKQKHQCKDCGIGYCEHGKLKYQCKDCGTGYCEHGKWKHICKNCGNGYCEHGKQKHHCNDCGTGLCEHGKNKHQCKNCGTGYCEHGKRKYECIKCGTGLCEHGKYKYRCKDCGCGYCEHGKQKHQCKDCGTGYCEHGKGKYRCKDCGNGYCEHGKLKFQCKDCGIGFCDHGKRKNKCKDCGTGYCNHGKTKNQCNECGTGRCEHGKIKHQCKECGTGRCEHGNYKQRCKDCGTGYCEHGKQKYNCKDCGTGRCEHGKQTRYCQTCDFHTHPENWCKLCNYIYINKTKYKKYNGYCFRCYCVTFPDADIQRKYKLKEHHLRDTLKNSYPNIKMIFDKKIDDGCSFRRPDVRIELLTHSLIIECDENKHNGYSCENKRTMELFQDLGNRPIIILRFNPDSYKNEHGNIINGCFKTTANIQNSIQLKEWSNRIDKLKERIDFYIKNIPTKEVTIEHLFYNAS